MSIPPKLIQVNLLFSPLSIKSVYGHSHEHVYSSYAQCTQLLVDLSFLKSKKLLVKKNRVFSLSLTLLRQLVNATA